MGMAFKAESGNPMSKMVVAYGVDYLNYTTNIPAGVNQIVIRIFDTSNGDLISTNFLGKTAPFSPSYKNNRYLTNNRIAYTEDGAVYLTLEHIYMPCHEKSQYASFDYRVLKFYDDDLSKVDQITHNITKAGPGDITYDFDKNM